MILKFGFKNHQTRAQFGDHDFPRSFAFSLRNETPLPPFPVIPNAFRVYIESISLVHKQEEREQ